MSTGTKSRQAPSVKKFCREQGLNSPSQRLTFFQSADALQVFTAQIVEEQTARLLRDRTRLRNVVCSAGWADAAWEHNEQFPPGGDDTSMVLSDVATRWDTEEDGVAHRRWMPPNNVSEEDYIDGLPYKEAAYLGANCWPASPSARAIQVLSFYAQRNIPHNADDRGRIGRKRAASGSKAKENS